MKRNYKTVYLDHAASTPLDSRVFNAMKPFFTSAYGNPSSLHHKGTEARQAVEASRKIIAEIVGARPEEIVFTSGGTEGCNLAVLGCAQMNTGKETDKHGHIITTQIEHHAVLEPVKMLKQQGWEITVLPVDKEGFISLDDLKKAIRKDTALVSVMYANNEIGTIEPIAEIGRMIKAQNARRKTQSLPEIIFHTDACQAVGALDLNVNRLQVDLMSVSASKIYGPKGTGFLYIRQGIKLKPIFHGGGQERGLRSGTENVAGIVGLAKALELTQAHREQENKRQTELRDYFIKKIRKILPKITLNLNGPAIERAVPPKFDGRQKMGVQGMNRLANNINIIIPGVEGEALMLYLDACGICVSTGSACATGSTDASHVLRAIGRSEKQARESIRITLGKGTTKRDLDYVVKVLKKVILLILDER